MACGCVGAAQEPGAAASALLLLLLLGPCCCCCCCRSAALLRVLILTSGFYSLLTLTSWGVRVGPRTSVGMAPAHRTLSAHSHRTKCSCSSPRSGSHARPPPSVRAWDRCASTTTLVPRVGTRPHPLMTCRHTTAFHSTLGVSELVLSTRRGLDDWRLGSRIDV